MLFVSRESRCIGGGGGDFAWIDGEFFPIY
jgi:hypothetical protein